MKKLIPVFLMLSSPSTNALAQVSREYWVVKKEIEVLDDTAGRDYLIDNHGLGIAATYHDYDSHGTSIFYDYNFRKHGKQLHVYVNSLNVDKYNLADRKIIESSRQTIGLSLRTHIRYGLYIGYGVNFSNYNFAYDNTFAKDPAIITHQSSSGAFTVEAGWCWSPIKR